MRRANIGSFLPLIIAGLILTACGGERNQPSSSSTSSQSQGQAQTSAPAQAAQQPGSSAPTAAGKIHVDFWHYFTQQHIAALKELITRFQKDNPNIEINPVYQGSPPQLSQKLSSAFAASPPNNPTMSTVYENWTSDYVSKGLMDAVQDRFSGPDALSESEQQDIIKVFQDANTWNGKMVTMPFNKSIYVLYMNMDRLAKAGFTTAPKTREEFRQAVEKTTEREGNRVKTYGFGMGATSEAFTEHLFAGGGSYFDDQNKPIFDGADGLAALSFISQLHKAGNVYVTTEYLDAPLGNQQIAMFIYSSASFPFVKRSVADKFKWSVAAIPGAEGKDARYLMQGTNVGIFKDKPEAERAAAWKFLRFITSTKSCVYWATHTGYMPIRYSMLKEPELQEYMAGNIAYATAAGLVLSDKGKQEPRMAVWEGMRDDIAQMVDRVVNTGADPAKDLALTKAKIEERMKHAQSDQKMTSGTK